MGYNLVNRLCAKPCRKTAISLISINAPQVLMFYIKLVGKKPLEGFRFYGLWLTIIVNLKKGFFD